MGQMHQISLFLAQFKELKGRMGVLFVLGKAKLDRRVLHCNPERKKRAPVVLNVMCWSSDLQSYWSVPALILKSLKSLKLALEEIVQNTLQTNFVYFHTSM